MKGRKKTQKRLGYAMILLGLAVVLLALLHSCGGEEVPQRQFEFEENQETLATEPAAMDTPSISIPGFKTLTIPAYTTSVSAHLYNPESNPCYFEISITLKGGEQEIYKSKLLAPGTDLYTITLSQGVAAGTYEAVLCYNTYSMDGNFTPMNGAQVPFTLVVS